MALPPASTPGTGSGASPDWRRAKPYLHGLVRALWRECRANRIHDSAASLTYTSLFAIVPMMTVAFAILQMTPQLARVGKHVEALVFNSFVPSASAQVQQYLTSFAAQASSLTAIGVLFLFITSVLMLLTVERAFNRIWHVRKPRPIVPSMLVYWALLTLGPLVIASGLAASTWVLSSPLMGGPVGTASRLHDMLVFAPFVLSSVFFTLAYIVVPNCPVPVRDGVIGGLFSSILLELARHGFSFLMSRFTAYEFVYGAFAAVPLFLIWIYISWLITLVGVVFVHVLATDAESLSEKPGSFVALMRLVAELARRQKAGISLSVDEGWRLAHRNGIADWEALSDSLQRRRIIERTENGSVFLIRDLHTMPMSELARFVAWDALDGAKNSTGEQDTFARDANAAISEAVGAFDARMDESVADFLARERP